MEDREELFSQRVFNHSACVPPLKGLVFVSIASNRSFVIIHIMQSICPPPHS